MSVDHAERQHRTAIGGLLLVAVLLTATLIAFAGRYGYHRDELYFLMLGEHPQWGYIDQPPLGPLLAHATASFGDSLYVLRTPPALAAGATALITGLLAREFGASRGAQVLAAAAWSISAVTFAAGHLATTTAYDLLGWAAMALLLVTAIRRGGYRWLLLGLVIGIALQFKTLPLAWVGALFLGVLLVGPRRILSDRALWLGALVAAVVWAPNLIWQASNGWPQLGMSKAIATGSSGTSEPRALFIPFQFVLFSPVLVPMWAWGWWRLARFKPLAQFRFFALAFPILAVVLLAVGGKPYYLCGAYSALLAAGAQPILDRVRRWVIALAMAVGLAINALLFLPVLPVSALADTPIPAINYDAGETVGWPGFVDAVRHQWDALPDRANSAIVTGNYGEAGAIHHFAPGIPVFSGHNSLRTLGPPPDSATSILTVGITPGRLAPCFLNVKTLANTPTPFGLENDEAGGPILLAQGRTCPWPKLWPMLEHTG